LDARYIAPLVHLLGEPAAMRLLSVGNALLDWGSYQDAEPVLRKSLALLAQNAPDGWPHACATMRLGASLAGQGRFSEAEPLMLDDYRDLKAHETLEPPTPAPFLAEARRRLALMYSASGRPDDAERWREGPTPSTRPSTRATTALPGGTDAAHAARATTTRRSGNAADR
jgi:hypothetical protein